MTPALTIGSPAAAKIIWVDWTKEKERVLLEQIRVVVKFRKFKPNSKKRK
jgi:hypothetical protein